jgi:hypothetical protein
MEMHPFYRVLDPVFIWFYRLTGHAGMDLVIGTLVLAIVALLIGEATVFLAYWLIRNRIAPFIEEASKYQTLSMEALKAGNKEAYKAANKLANDAFGQSFFQQAALSAAFLWPVFFALAWMQYRFLDIELSIPGTSWSIGFIGVFIPIYVTAYLTLKRLPWFRRIKGVFERSLAPAH